MREGVVITREEWLTEFGTAVKNGRLAVGWTQTELAQALDLTRSSIANIEAGRQDVSSSTAAHVVSLLGLDLPGWQVAPNPLADRLAVVMAENRWLTSVIRRATEILGDV